MRQERALPLCHVFSSCTLPFSFTEFFVLPLLINCVISISALWMYVSSLELHIPATT